MASAFCQPVSDSAIGFNIVTLPSTSAVMTPSPMLARVTSNHLRCCLICRVSVLEADVTGDFSLWWLLESCGESISRVSHYRLSFKKTIGRTDCLRDLG